MSGRAPPQLPTAVAVDAFGVAYIADSFAGAVYTLTPAGTVSLLAGREDRNAPFGTGLIEPAGIALDANRNVYVIASRPPGSPNSQNVFRITPTGEIAPAAPAAALVRPTDIAADAAGNLYVVDAGPGVVRKITPAGSVSTIAGGDGNGQVPIDGSTTGPLINPRAIAVGSDGTVYVSEADAIRRIDPATGKRSAFAGIVPSGPGFGLHATDRAGNVFVAVRKPPYNNGLSIDRIAPDGTITTVLSGSLNEPRSMAFDGAGNLYAEDISCLYSCGSAPVSKASGMF